MENKRYEYNRTRVLRRGWITCIPARAACQVLQVQDGWCSKTDTSQGEEWGTTPHRRHFPVNSKDPATV